jgi:hypothetical protein
MRAPRVRRRRTVTHEAPLVKTIPTLLAALSTLLATGAQAQITHDSWTGAQSTAWMGFAVESIRQPGGGRRLLIGTPNFDHYVGFGIDQGAGVVTCYAGASPGGVPLFSVYGDEDQHIGRAIANVGDLDGDKYDEFAIGAPSGSASPTLNKEGFVLVCSGKDGSVRFTLIGPQDYSEFGTSVAGPGDVNGDGTSDILVGAPEYHLTPGFDRHGRVYVYSGVNGELLQTFTGVAHSALGNSVAGVGDVDDDGRRDFAVGVAEDDTLAIQAGRVIIVRGFVGGVWKSLYGNTTQEHYGYSIASGGDANGDGEWDLIVGAPGGSTDNGLVEVRLGPSFNTLWKLFISATSDDGMGRTVDFAGDVDKDGCADIVMGAIAGTGKVYGRSGKTGATILPAQTGTWTGDAFGFAIAGVGDANEDGWDDVLVGVPFSGVVTPEAGGARLIGWQVVQPNAGGGGVGDAELTVFGAPLATGYSAELRVTGGPPNAAAWLLVSAGQLPLPFKGGLLIPDVNAALTLFLPTDAQGEVTTWAPGGGGPFSVYVQHILQDAAQAQGWQLTLATRIDFLP